MTFGYKAAVWLAGIERHRERLAQLRPRVLVGEFGGAVGALNSLGDRGLDVQAGVCAELGLGQPLISWHTMHDAFAETGTVLALICATLEKIAVDVKVMAATEIAEVQEPDDGGGRGASSTMPQKRNPISCAYITACNGVVRQHAAALLAASVADFERATGISVDDSRHHHVQSGSRRVHREVEGRLRHTLKGLDVRNAGMEEDDGRAALQLLPDRREALVAEVHALVAREHDHAVSSVVVVGAPDLGHRGFGIRHGQGGEVAEATGRLLPKLAAVVVHPTCHVELLRPFPRRHERRRQRDHPHTGAEQVHRLLSSSGDQPGVPQSGLPILASNASAQKGGIMWKCVPIRSATGDVLPVHCTTMQSVKAVSAADFHHRGGRGMKANALSRAEEWG